MAFIVSKPLNPELQLCKNIYCIMKCSFPHHYILLEENYLNH